MMTLVCGQDGCKNTVISMRDFNFICQEHSTSIPSFQDYAFDKKIDRRSVIKEMRPFIEDERDIYSRTRGFQVHTIRREEREVPEWARTKEGIQKILLTAFPKIQDPKQRVKAGRWAQVIQLYFQLGWTYTQVADELNEKPNVILMVIRGITYTAEGKTWNGRPRKR
jgi:hypothetical protein